MPNQIDSVIIQVRARLQSRQIKLWLDPYYYQEIGVVESELEKLADEFSGSLGISVSNCKLALTELQDGALRKLAARKEFDETGLATFSVRRVNNTDGTESVFEIKCALTGLGAELQTKIAEKLELSDANRIKMISAGKIVNPTLALVTQGIRNNQQFMVIVSAVDSQDAMYDKIKKIKDDVETIVNAGNRHFEMEDQDGNPVFLPPAENKALLMALGFCEKARSAIKRNQFDEALILLLEADEKFTTCNSKFLESVDNYALVNLDIVWCYLCLKNLTQLPDAERRLEICQKSFNRSYGKDLKRLITIKGESCPERALIVRLHLLQGVLLFHQNRRDEAYDKLDTAQSELRDLKVDEDSVLQLMEMGFDPSEARIALRACKGDLNQAANFIHDRKAKVTEARMKSKRERAINANLDQSASNAEGWVNPRSVCTLVEMGFPRNVVIVALKKTENDVPRALDMLQTNMDELIQAVPTEPLCSDEKMLRELKRMGFNEEMAKVALDATLHDDEQSMNSLLKMVGNRTELMNTIQTAVDTAGPSTSKGSSIAKKLLKKVKAESNSREAYKRFNEDISTNENEYLDLSLNQEEQILAEYKRLLEQ